MAGYRQHLVAGVFHGAGFVDADVARFGCDDAFVVAQHGGDDRRIGLRAAGQEKDLGPRRFARLADLLLRTFAVMVHTIPGQLLQIGRSQTLQNLRMRPLGIVTSKGNHGLTYFMGLSSTNLQK